jgi:hypothetical protein
MGNTPGRLDNNGADVFASSATEAEYAAAAGEGSDHGSFDSGDDMANDNGDDRPDHLHRVLQQGTTITKRKAHSQRGVAVVDDGSSALPPTATTIVLDGEDEEEDDAAPRFGRLVKEDDEDDGYEPRGGGGEEYDDPAAAAADDEGAEEGQQYASAADDRGDGDAEAAADDYNETNSVNVDDINDDRDGEGDDTEDEEEEDREMGELNVREIEAKVLLIVRKPRRAARQNGEATTATTAAAAAELDKNTELAVAVLARRDTAFSRFLDTLDAAHARISFAEIEPRRSRFFERCLRKARSSRSITAVRLNGIVFNARRHADTSNLATIIVDAAGGGAAAAVSEEWRMTDNCYLLTTYWLARGIQEARILSVVTTNVVLVGELVALRNANQMAQRDLMALMEQHLDGPADMEPLLRKRFQDVRNNIDRIQLLEARLMTAGDTTPVGVAAAAVAAAIATAPRVVGNDVIRSPFQT